MIDVNKPVSNPNLVQAIEQMQKNNTGESQNHMIDEVMKAHFITPVSITPMPEAENNRGEVTLKEETKINFNIIENNANQQFFLAFTDWEELGKWHKSENQQTVIVTFDDFASMVLGEGSHSSGFVINSHSHSIIFNREIVLALRDEKERRAKGGVIEQEVKKETKVLLGQPKVYPKEMIDAISSYLEGQDNVKSVYLRLMIRDKEESYLLVVDFEGDHRETFNGIADAAKPYLNGMFIDMVPYASEFGQSAVKGVEPFYEIGNFS